MSEIFESLGALQSPYDMRDYVACVGAPEEFPEEFSVFDKYNPTVKNQGSVGSCVAHSLSTIIEWFNATQESSNVVFSTNYIYGNRTKTDYTGHGLIVRDALKTIAAYGDAPESVYSGNTEVSKVIEQFEARDESVDKIAYPNRISTYYQLKTVDAIKSNLMHVGPVVVAVSWKASYYLDENNVLHFTSDVARGGHCMVICGWNKYGWIIRNSWGDDWGENGEFIYPFDADLWEAWGVTDEVTGETISVKKTSKLAKIFYKLVNAVANLVLKFTRKE